MELAGTVVNHANDDPDRDMENNRTLSASWFAASPHCIMNLLTCSTVETSPCPENLVKSGILYLWGKGIWSYTAGYEVLYIRDCYFGFKPNWSLITLAISFVKSWPVFCVTWGSIGVIGCAANGAWGEAEGCATEGCAVAGCAVDAGRGSAVFTDWLFFISNAYWVFWLDGEW